MKKIKDFKNYAINEHGDVTNLRTGRVLKNQENQKGYKHLQLSYLGKTKTISIHREVYIAYKGSISDCLEINHIDGVKSNNHISNLEEVTKKENMIKAVENGQIKTGADCANSVSVDQIDVVSGEVICNYGSINIAHKKTGVYASAISSVCSGNRITAGGFKWRKA
jgi:hypothetical protein